MNRTLVIGALLSLFAGACAKDSPSGRGCASDRDCKGTRICADHACVDPATPSASPVASKPATEVDPEKVSAAWLIAVGNKDAPATTSLTGTPFHYTYSLDDHGPYTAATAGDVPELFRRIQDDDTFVRDLSRENDPTFELLATPFAKVAERFPESRTFIKQVSGAARWAIGHLEGDGASHMFALAVLADADGTARVVAFVHDSEYVE